MDKKKLIDELVKDIENVCADMVYSACGAKPCSRCLAVHLIESGYLKKPEKNST